MQTIWDYYTYCLNEAGMRTIFGMVGDGVGLLESATYHGNFSVIESFDQKIGVGMAIGFAQATRKCAIYSASPGPGLANASMGILEAYSMQVPLIIIANGVARNLNGTGGFQEFDSLSFMKPITKWAYRIESEKRLAWALQRAFFLANNGKKGPVYVEIPNDLVNHYPSLPYPKLEHSGLKFCADKAYLEIAIKELRQAKCPVIILGGGTQDINARTSVQVKTFLIEFAENIGAAIFCTASGRGIFPENHPLFCGLIGLYLTPPADKLINEADLFFVLGSQLEETALMGIKEKLDQKSSIQLDINPEIIGRSVNVKYGLVGDLIQSLEELNSILQRSQKVKFEKKEWMREIQQVKVQQEKISNKKLNLTTTAARTLFHSISRLTNTTQDVCLVLENGLHDMWGYFFPVCKLSARTRIFSPGEQTGLGLAMGIAFGIKISDPSVPVICVIGDGAFLFGQAVFLTLRKHKVGITFIVINNHGFGWPRLAQKSAVGCDFEISQDLQHISNLFDVVYQKPKKISELAEMLNSALQANLKQTSVIIEIEVKYNQDLPFGVKKHFLEYHEEPRG